LLTANILRGCIEKVVMARGTIPILPGHHDATGKRSSFHCQTHHFKWHGKNLLDLLEKRAGIYAKQRLPYCREPINFVNYCRSNGNIVNSRSRTVSCKAAQTIGI